MLDETPLLRAYAETGSESAFRILVERHCGLVYRAALRQVGGSAALAEDVTQTVFLLLAQKAPSLVRHPNLAGWLFATAHFVSSRTARAEHRRKRREAAVAAPPEEDLAAAADWERMRPLLDGAILSLNRPDRQAIVLRYLQGRPVEDVARSLRVTDAAAYKRLERAVERLRSVLARRGITSSASALGLLIAGEGEAEVPAALAIAVAGQALSGAGAGPAGWLHFMATAKTTAGFLSVAAILCLPGLGIALHEWRAAERDAAAAAAAAGAARADQAQLSRLRLEAARADEARTQRQSRLPAARLSTGDPKADGRRFLTAFPQAREMLRRMLKSGYANNYAAFYRLAGLSPAQIEQLEDQAAARWIENVELRPGNLGGPSNLTNLSDEQLRQILGHPAWQQFQDYNRTLVARGWANQVAADVAYGAAPLSPETTDRLAAIVIANSPDYQNGKAVNLAAINWEKVQEQAQAAVPSSLWPAAQSAIWSSQDGIQFNRALARASRAAP